MADRSCIPLPSSFFKLPHAVAKLVRVSALLSGPPGGRELSLHIIKVGHILPCQELAIASSPCWLDLLIEPERHFRCLAWLQCRSFFPSYLRRQHYTSDAYHDRSVAAWQLGAKNRQNPVHKCHERIESRCEQDFKKQRVKGRVCVH